MIKFLTIPTIISGSINIVKPDGLDLLRVLPVLRNFVPKNTNMIENFTTKTEISTFVVQSDELTVGVKQDVTIEGVTMFGLLPIEQDGDEYLCTCDSIK